MSTTPSNPVQSCQPKGETLPERLRTMPSSLNDACRTMDEAAERVEELETAFRFIADGYDNHDVNHLDYRVKVYQVALDVLQPKGAAV